MARKSKAQAAFKAEKGGPRCACGAKGHFADRGTFYCHEHFPPRPADASRKTA